MQSRNVILLLETQTSKKPIFALNWQTVLKHDVEKESTKPIQSVCTTSNPYLQRNDRILWYFGLVLKIFHEVAYKTFKWIFHKALNLF